MKRASVVIPCRGYAATLRDAVRSALAQGEFVGEVLVVDDDGHDVRRAVRGLGRRVCVARGPRRNAAAARNVGWRLARGSHIAFLDADDLWLPGKLMAQFSALGREPGAEFVYCDAARIDLGTGGVVGRWSQDSPPAEGWVLRRLVERNFVPSPTPVVDRGLLNELGGFDEQMEAWEDIDLWIRCAARTRFAYVPRVLAHYRMHAGSLSTRSLAMTDGELRSQEKLFVEPPADSEEARWRRRASALALCRRGIALYLNNRFREARETFLRAWRLDIQSVLKERSGETFLKSLMGPTVVNVLRRIRRAGPVASR